MEAKPSVGGSLDTFNWNVVVKFTIFVNLHYETFESGCQKPFATNSELCIRNLVGFCDRFVN